MSKDNKYMHVDGTPCKPRKDGSPRVCAGGYQEEKQDAWGREVFSRALPLARKTFGPLHLAALAQYCFVDSGYTAAAKNFQKFLGGFSKVKQKLQLFETLKNNTHYMFLYQSFRELMMNKNINAVIKKVYKLRKNKKMFDK